MRIIGGKFKGQKIDFLKTKITRPLKDSVKENIFNILKHSRKIKVDIEKSNVLDLYSGVGSFGLECISRGAKEVTFVEQDRVALDILKKNLKHLLISSQANVINQEIEYFLKNCKKKFSIFFFDPPFANDSFKEGLVLIKKNKIFSDNNVIVIHRERKSNESFENYIDVILTKNYGRSRLIFGLFN